MCRVIFFLLAWATAVHGTNQMQRADPVSAPHEGCTFHPESYSGFNNGSHYVPTTLCTQSQEFVLPDTFNVSLVNADTEALWFRFTTVIVKDNYNPFPNLPHLRHFIMDLFYSDANPRFPLNDLLIHNKNHITHLDLTRVNMSGINRADFNGFVRLNSLRLDRCQITAIGKDIFEEIGTIVDAPSLSGIYPQLEIFIISDNIEQLDWAFLSPISRSLKILDLNKINLRNLTSTADSNNPVFLESIRKLDMSNNMVSTLPRFLYESLNLISLNEFDFTSYHQEQQFCENYVGCKCCELYNFTMWYRSNVPEISYHRIGLTCGGRTNTVYDGPFKPECGPTDPPTRAPTTVTPGPTTPTIHPTTSTEPYPPTDWTTTQSTQFTESYPPTDWTTGQPTRQTYIQTSPAPGSQGNCKTIEFLIVSVVSLCLLPLILF